MFVYVSNTVRTALSGGEFPLFSKTRQVFLKGIPQDFVFMHRALYNINTINAESNISAAHISFSSFIELLEM